MRFRDDPFDVVLVGRWNPFIFSPEWVKQYLRSTETPVIVAFPIGDPSAPVRITFDDIAFFPGQSRLEIRPESRSIHKADAAMKVAIKILELLPHTPISAVGVNFRLEDSIAPDQVYSCFSFYDNQRISADKYTIRETTLTRQYRLSDGSLLNLQIVYSPERVIMEFNFHSDVDNARNASERLMRCPPSRRLIEVKEFLGSVYDINIDALEDNI